jgi:hypothetical protein
MAGKTQSFELCMYKKERADNYRLMAKDLRAIAGAVKHREAKADIAGLAHRYDRLADRIENGVPGWAEPGSGPDLQDWAAACSD